MLNKKIGIEINLDGKLLSTRYLSLNNSLQSLRKEMNILNASFVDQDNNEIDLEDEDFFTINDIVNLKTVQLRTKKEREEHINLNQTFTAINPSYYNLEDELIIKNYSNIAKKAVNNLIYQYFFDNFEKEDYEKAKVIIFIGKTGDGKTTAINGFFNIIKGVKMEDNYRYILIKEKEKAQGQAESQTDGIHLYYIKDKNNMPIIIIDSQGFGDTRGNHYDRKIFEAFLYTFKNIINHINIICFIAVATCARLDYLIKYIFSCATSLFSDDICKNFIILHTHANKYTIKGKPDFIDCIQNDVNYNAIKDKLDYKWWFAVDSKIIFENDKDFEYLIKYSFNQFNELYDKLKNSRNRELTKSAQIIEIRNEIKNVINNIISYNKNLKYYKERLPQIDRNKNESINKKNDLEYKIRTKEQALNKIKALDTQLTQLDQEHKKRIKELEDETETYIEQEIESSNSNHTCCDKCKKNCHHYCDCFGSFVSRCTIFPVFGDGCDKCGHTKSWHKVQTKYHYVDKTKTRKKDNSKKISEEYDKYCKKRSEIYDLQRNKWSEKFDLEWDLKRLYEDRKNINQPYIYDNEKENVKKNIEATKKDIKLLIMKLKGFSQKIECIAMNQNHIDVENEYIDTLIKQIDDIGKDKNNEKPKLKVAKNINELYKKIINISEEDLIKNDIEFIFENIKIFNYNLDLDEDSKSNRYNKIENKVAIHNNYKEKSNNNNLYNNKNGKTLEILNNKEDLNDNLKINKISKAYYNKDKKGDMNRNKKGNLNFSKNDINKDGKGKLDNNNRVKSKYINDYYSSRYKGNNFKKGITNNTKDKSNKNEYEKKNVYLLKNYSYRDINKINKNDINYNSTKSNNPKNAYMKDNYIKNNKQKNQEKKELLNKTSIFFNKKSMNNSDTNKIINDSFNNKKDVLNKDKYSTIGLKKSWNKKK